MIDPVELSVSLGLSEEKEGGGRATIRLILDHPRQSDVCMCACVRVYGSECLEQVQRTCDLK